MNNGERRRRMPRVYLIRHGETEWSINGRHTGTTDIPLTQNGVDMVRAMAPRVIGADKLIDPAHVRHIIVSPRARAQVTSRLLFENDMPPDCSWSTEPDIAEWDYGAYEGMLTKDIRKERPGWEIWRDGCPPGHGTPGESPEQMTERVDRVIARIREIHAKAECVPDDEVDYSDVILFSHGHFTRSFIARWCQLPIQAGYNFSSDAGGLAMLGYQHMSLKEPSLLGLNWYTEYQMKTIR
ncbi:uncharacterized protein CcaverHIS019_0506600 [Cutaneotrichosporon cavernicola]|uniref:Phosphoglycerate mutase-like protein n=1 Tax=Cutaneotrichosporon cavernicola TaxID=279322 RepID=A0AA48QX89_9TREE|nr:uncharacterized protein CcaverHIS019_0506600 [Cutaneotrichosporon cavernicola]BEI93032.1 hypothetical protein CcaverHIS019_0506600 [Cutaneotrichosporon cavernicola]BEJ00808.1 hypothetical protein CcaverHIS631_0506650 [Cutaneotrichosporon cavernicola]BEJ08575.1 hypothetical protein CcaverHIS641_0506690 [Cutaneotrichosporon cavernicola]